MNIPFLLTAKNLPILLRELADNIENQSIKIRKVDLMPTLEINSANPFVFPLEILDSEEFEDSTTVLHLSVEVNERAIVNKVLDKIRK
jgi:hypothetical protein